MQISFWIAPWRSCIAEENKVRDYTSWIDCDHLTHSTKSRVLFLVVANVSQRWAPEWRKSLEIYNKFSSHHFFCPQKLFKISSLNVITSKISKVIKIFLPFAIKNDWNCRSCSDSSQNLTLNRKKSMRCHFYSSNWS